MYFYHPVEPIIPIFSPFLISKLIFFITIGSSFLYLKQTSLKIILFLRNDFHYKIFKFITNNLIFTFCSKDSITLNNSEL